MRLNTNRRNAQNRNNMPRTAPTTLAETLSASAESQPMTLRVTHRQAIGITNEARFTATYFSGAVAGSRGRRFLNA